jgi:NAD-dependent dihydropyrimidine dehydrogenase PreA subunit
MAFVSAEPCIGVKDTACVDACPVDCIHPKKDTVYEDGRPGFNVHEYFSVIKKEPRAAKEFPEKLLLPSKLDAQPSRAYITG